MTSVPLTSPPLPDRLLGAGTTQRSSEPYLDGLRAVAILAVVLDHVYGFAGSPRLWLGGLDITDVVTSVRGVDLFFILSGFLLARPWFRSAATGSSRPDLKVFWRRRFRRLVPGYWVSILVVVVVFVPVGLLPVESVTGELGLWNLGAHLTFAQNYVPLAMRDFAGINGPLWTLTVEVTSYLLVPVLAIAMFGRRWLITIPVLTALAVVWVLTAWRGVDGLVAAMMSSVSGPAAVMGVPADPGFMRSSLANQYPTYAVTFILGIALAKLVIVRESASTHQAPRWWATPRWAVAGLVGGVMVGIGSLLWVHHELRLDPTDQVPAYLYRIPTAVAYALVIYGLTFGPRLLRRPLELTALRIIGMLSFGIYLYHMPVLTLANMSAQIRQIPPALLFVLGLAGCIVLSALCALISWHLVERRFLVGRPKERSPGVKRARRALVLTAPAVILAAVLFVQPPVPAPETSALSPLVPVVPTGGSLVVEKTGKANLQEAMDRGVQYDAESPLLTACGAGIGTTAVLVTPNWSLSATAFSCGSVEAGQTVLADLTAWEAGRGLTLSPLGLPAVAAFISVNDLTTPGFPARAHIRYVSGDTVVGLVIQAVGPAELKSGIQQVLTQVRVNFPADR